MSISFGPGLTTSRDAVMGCFLGGAIGDALGAEVEFDSLAVIRSRFGPDGVAMYDNSRGQITDDTQMTLFTAEGLLRASNRFRAKGICHVPTMIHHSYLRWLSTQSSVDAQQILGAQMPNLTSGWLLTNRSLHVARAPGHTCLAALRSGQAGTVESHINDSKGCGGVMRVAPIGLAPVDAPFALAADAASLTHGHPSGYLSAGAMAVIVAGMASGSPLLSSVYLSLEELVSWEGHSETSAAVLAAVDLAVAEPDPTPEIVETLGAGWVGDEALAISLYAALVARDFEHGVRAAVNHSGDSDSTGAITGSILGTLLGASAIPSPFVEGLAERELVETVASDWSEHFWGDASKSEESPDFDRYPGW